MKFKKVWLIYALIFIPGITMDSVWSLHSEWWMVVHELVSMIIFGIVLAVRTCQIIQENSDG